MLNFTKDFNSCKTVGCKNFGIPNSESYIQHSERLGYLSTECTLCGSNAPWVNNQLVADVLSEKWEQLFAHKIIGCTKCSPYFFITDATESKRCGFTSAGTQRKKCTQCGSVFTLPEYKNIGVLKAVLSSLLPQYELTNSDISSNNLLTDKTEIKQLRAVLKETGLSSRLYYFYLHKLALILSNFSRSKEELALKRQYLGMHSEGRVIQLNHQRALYNIFTAEVSSGYILLQSNNLTQQQVGDAFIYKETESTLPVNINSTDLEAVLLARYERNLKRNHFEQLIMGPVKPIANCNAIYPDKVAYVHFQLLKTFTYHVKKYDHFIEHESTLRSAALISSRTAVHNKNANIYFFLPFKSIHENLTGKRYGWWNDVWFNNQQGAFCPITCKFQSLPEMPIKNSDAIENFSQFIDLRLNKSSNSMQVINNLLEIYRVLFNYCVAQNSTSAAKALGLTDKVFHPDNLLDEAVKQLLKG